MAHTVTVTAKTGPDRTNTAIVFNNVDRVDLDLQKAKVQIYVQNQSGNQIKEYELSAITTVTCTVVAGQWSLTLA